MGLNHAREDYAGTPTGAYSYSYGYKWTGLPHRDGLRAGHPHPLLLEPERAVPRQPHRRQRGEPATPPTTRSASTTRASRSPTGASATRRPSPSRARTAGSRGRWARSSPISWTSAALSASATIKLHLHERNDHEHHRHRARPHRRPPTAGRCRTPGRELEGDRVQRRRRQLRGLRPEQRQLLDRGPARDPGGPPRLERRREGRHPVAPPGQRRPLHLVPERHGDDLRLLPHPEPLRRHAVADPRDLGLQPRRQERHPVAPPGHRGPLRLVHGRHGRGGGRRRGVPQPEPLRGHPVADPRHRRLQRRRAEGHPVAPPGGRAASTSGS